MFGPPAPTEPTEPTVELDSKGLLVEIDSEGLPWDVRIHVGSRAKIAKGTWRVKPRTDPAYLEEVKAELRSVMAAPVDPAAAAPDAPTTILELGKAMALEGIAHTDQKVQDACAALGIAGVLNLGARPELIPQFWAAIHE
jgi:hypothetical protein